MTVIILLVLILLSVWVSLMILFNQADYHGYKQPDPDSSTYEQGWRAGHAAGYEDAVNND